MRERVRWSYAVSADKLHSTSDMAETQASAAPAQFAAVAECIHGGLLLRSGVSWPIRVFIFERSENLEDLKLMGDQKRT